MTELVVCSRHRLDEALLAEWRHRRRPDASLVTTRSFDEAWAYLECASAALLFLAFDSDLDGAYALLERLGSARPEVRIVAVIPSHGRELEAALIGAGAHDVVVREDLEDDELDRALEGALAASLSASRAFADVRHAPRTTRSSFERTLEPMLRAARRRRARLGLVSVRLEGDSSTWHERPEEEAAILGAALHRVRTALRSPDLVLRLGVRELVVLRDDAASVAEIVGLGEAVAEALAAPITRPDGDVRVSTSVRIAVHPDHGTTPPELLECLDDDEAEIARLGRGVPSRLTPRNPTSMIVSRRQILERALPGAIERGEISVHYQPQWCIRDQVVLGVESLLRWNSPDLGAISPAEFVPIAEEIGEIETLGTHALRTACAVGERWRRNGLPVRVAVNVSSHQLRSQDFAETVRAALHDSGFPPPSLELEITEGALVDDADRARAVMSELRAEGILFAVDDFGTGHASLAYLKRLPLDVVKIDRDFVRGVPEDPENVALTSAIVALAQSLGLYVIAEGVETSREESFLRTLDCHAVQGFLHARPMPALEAESWLRRRTIASRAPR